VQHAAPGSRVPTDYRDGCRLTSSAPRFRCESLDGSTSALRDDSLLT
jgi:hypothetical protein